MMFMAVLLVSLSCPGRGAASLMPLRRAGTHSSGPRWVPVLQRITGVLRCARDTRPSHPRHVELRPFAGAVAAQRALLADRIGTLENPVLPGGEPREDF